MLLILIRYGCRRFEATRFRNKGRANTLVGWSPAYYDGGEETVQARGRTMNTVVAAGSSTAAYMYISVCNSLLYMLYIYIYIYKGKSVPLETWSGLEGSKKLIFLD